MGYGTMGLVLAPPIPMRHSHPVRLQRSWHPRNFFAKRSSQQQAASKLATNEKAVLKQLNKIYVNQGTVTFDKGTKTYTVTAGPAKFKKSTKDHVEVSVFKSKITDNFKSELWQGEYINQQNVEG
ncbi:hypothetical protein [Secundilactobacillus collinoides]|uniref:hypothetical protein n=1 Tax=Secundilactobacillus collinoides TaxID=33960 RepID=UPI0006D09413|nr:hypothetical protein [Secundilactobacillus collinoides]